MTRVTIINKLRKYLSNLEICKLELVSNDKNILLLFVVTDIIRNYESTKENEEEEVEKLLSKLVSICF